MDSTSSYDVFSNFLFDFWKLYIANGLTYIALDWKAASAKLIAISAVNQLQSFFFHFLFPVSSY